jgi:hypothetical protein
MVLALEQDQGFGAKPRSKAKARARESIKLTFLVRKPPENCSFSEKFVFGPWSLKVPKPT